MEISRRFFEEECSNKRKIEQKRRYGTSSLINNFAKKKKIKIETTFKWIIDHSGVTNHVSAKRRVAFKYQYWIKKKTSIGCLCRNQSLYLHNYILCNYVPMWEKPAIKKVFTLYLSNVFFFFLKNRLVVFFVTHRLRRRSMIPRYMVD